MSATAEDKKYEEEITLQFQVEYEPQQIKIEWKGKNQESHDRSFPVDFSDRTETKNELKQNFYQILSEITGKKLPWGTLTGIRPTKIPMKFLEEGKTEAEIRAYMQKTYFASDEKIDLSIDIAERELEILKKIDFLIGCKVRFLQRSHDTPRCHFQILTRLLADRGYPSKGCSMPHLQVRPPTSEILF